MPFKQHPTDPDLVIYKTNEYWIPKPWVGLTDEENSEIYNKLYTSFKNDDVNIADLFLISYEVETKLKEKNDATYT
jgi:hypothetical protein